jgi:multiple sugar transport system substrate-binding protein
MFGPKAKMSKIDGKYYGFPNGDMACVLFYNADILKDSGMDPANIPTKWSDFVPVAQKMTDLSKDIQGLPIRGREVSMWLALLHQGGGFFFRNDKEAMFAEKPGVDAAQFILDVYDKYKLSSRTSLNANEAFGQGKAPFLYNWTWYIGTLKTSYADTNFETRLLPTPTGKGPHGTYGPSYGIFVSYTNEKNKDAAWKFWKFAVSPEFQLGWSMLRGLVPSRLEAQKPEIFGKQPYKALAAAVKSNVSTSFFPDAVNSIRGTMIQKIMEGAPVQGTLSAAQKDLNTWLKDNSKDVWVYGKTWYDKNK